MNNPVALVKNGACVGVAFEGVFTHDEVNYRVDDLPSNAKELGIYEFHPATLSPPSGKRFLKNSLSIDDELGVVTESFEYVDIIEGEVYR